MQRLVNRLGSTVRLTVTCPRPEALVTACAARRIAFWNVKKRDGVTVEMTIYTKNARAVRALAARQGGEVRASMSRGLTAAAGRLRRRWALLAGFLLFYFLLRAASVRVWSIEVVGNDTVSTQRILAALEEEGFTLGTLAFTVRSEPLSNEVLQRIPELSWLAVNVDGAKATVLVRERVNKPELADRDAYCSIVAVKGGLIERMVVRAGQKVLTEGRAVLPGEVIVSGLAPETGRSGPVRADADVYARTWYELSAAATLTVLQKQYTGRERTRLSVIIAGKRINFYRNSGIDWPEYDKITQSYALKLWDGSPLPISLERQTLREYVKCPAEADRAQTEQLLRRSLIARLTELTDGGQMLSLDFAVSCADGVMTVTLRAECLEQIGTAQPINDYEGTGNE